ncbi:hypothetical protein C8R47DRAFT_1195235 [Mycena vitilis]|nr:hypothetical protein C8R47DRAFT_1195235 [Mycena vitilis]
MIVRTASRFHIHLTRTDNLKVRTAPTWFDFVSSHHVERGTPFSRHGQASSPTLGDFAVGTEWVPEQAADASQPVKVSRKKTPTPAELIGKTENEIDAEIKHEDEQGCRPFHLLANPSGELLRLLSQAKPGSFLQASSFHEPRPEDKLSLNSTEHRTEFSPNELEHRLKEKAFLFGWCPLIMEYLGQDEPNYCKRTSPSVTLFYPIVDVNESLELPPKSNTQSLAQAPRTEMTLTRPGGKLRELNTYFK